MEKETADNTTQPTTDSATESSADNKRQAEALATDTDSSIDQPAPASRTGATGAADTATPVMSSGALAVLVIFICAVIAGGIYWWSQNDQGASASGEQSGVDFGAATGASEEVVPLEEIPEVVATVNGEAVPKERLVENINQLEAAVSQQGQNPSDPAVAAQLRQQALDQTINNEVLAQAAAAAEVEVTDAEVAAELEQIRGQFPDEAAFTTQLENAGLTLEQLESNLGEQLAINQFIDASDAVSNLPEVTTEEARATYEQVTSQGNAEDFPAFAEVEAQIIAQLTQQNRQVAISELIDSLRESADVEVLF